MKWRKDRAQRPRSGNHAHGDRDPSFAYLSKENRLHCFSQRCFGDKPVDVFDFVGQMEACDFPSSARLLADRYGFGTHRHGHQKGTRPSQRKPTAREALEAEGWRQVAVYAMGDDVRKVRLEHPARIQPEKNRPEKTFIWEHRADDGTWKTGRGGRPHLPYCNAPFRDRDQVEVAIGVESERSADTAGNLGFPAFSFKEITTGNARVVAGMDLLLLPDKDDEGWRLLRQKADLLQPHARSISVIQPPADWPTAGDLHDAIADSGWGLEQVQTLLNTAEKYKFEGAHEQKKGTPRFKIWSLDSLRVADFKAPDPIVEDIIAEGETVALVGKPKAGSRG